MTTKRKPNIGTVSHGTMLNNDLLDSFADELERVDEIDEYAGEIAEARAVLTLWRRGWQDIIDSEETTELVNELVDALNACALPYTYFGTHEGDGSDFGFWPDMDSVNELRKFNDLSEVPEDIDEDYAVVNDHGNVSVYAADGTLIWDCV